MSVIRFKRINRRNAEIGFSKRHQKLNDDIAMLGFVGSKAHGAAISSVMIPPREFLAKYLKREARKFPSFSRRGGCKNVAKPVFTTGVVMGTQPTRQ